MYDGCGNNMNFIRFANIYLGLSAILILISIVSIAVFRYDLGIDFVGGSVMEVEYQDARPSNQEIQDQLKDLPLKSLSVQPVEEKQVILRMNDISEETHQQVLEKLGNVQEHRFESIGPAIGRELRQKTFLLSFLSLAAIAIYIAFAFRRVSRPLPSWSYSLATLLVLLHDILI